jgi:hypothetical protein
MFIARSTPFLCFCLPQYFVVFIYLLLFFLSLPFLLSFVYLSVLRCYDIASGNNAEPHVRPPYHRLLLLFLIHVFTLDSIGYESSYHH